MRLLRRHAVLLGEWLEAFAEGVVGVGDNNECLVVELLNLVLNVAHLLAVYNEEDHLLVAICVHTLSLDVGTTATQLVEDIMAHSVGVLVADDVKQFVARSTVDCIAQYLSIHEDTYSRVEREQQTLCLLTLGQTDAEADNHKTAEHDDSVGEQYTVGELHLSESVQEHTRDIRTARCGIVADDDTHAHAAEATTDDGRKHQVLREVNSTAEQ